MKPSTTRSKEFGTEAPPIAARITDLERANQQKIF